MQLQPHLKGYKRVKPTLARRVLQNGGVAMYAIIETGGKQIKVQENDVIYVEKIEANDGDKVTFNRVLMVGGEKTSVGTPFVKNASVTGTVDKQGKGKKITVFKYRPKKSSKTKQGHRQPYTKITIDKINLA